MLPRSSLVYFRSCHWLVICPTSVFTMLQCCTAMLLLVTWWTLPRAKVQRRWKRMRICPGQARGFTLNLCSSHRIGLKSMPMRKRHDLAFRTCWTKELKEKGMTWKWRRKSQMKSQRTRVWHFLGRGNHACTVSFRVSFPAGSLWNMPAIVIDQQEVAEKDSDEEDSEESVKGKENSRRPSCSAGSISKSSFLLVALGQYRT